MGIGEECL